MRNTRIYRLLIEVLAGEGSSGASRNPLARVARVEDGMVTWATLLAVVCFCALIALVFNVGRVSNEKLEAQNAADSAAYSASLVQARALNAITTTNHLMGELTALYVLHHAIGGKVLDDGGTKNTAVVIGMNLTIRIGHPIAWFASLPTLLWGGSTPEGYGSCADVPRGEATIYDSKCVLKSLLIAAITAHGNGSATIMEGVATLWLFGSGAALIAEGIAMQRAANLMIKKIKQEYNFINQLERFALNTRSAKRQIVNVLRALWVYENAIVTGSRVVTDRAAATAASNNKCVGEVVGTSPLPGLPVVKESTQSNEKFQLLRATYPWVREWRSKLLLIVFDGFCTLSRAARFYEYHSDVYARDICRSFRQDYGFKLYVLNEGSPVRREKGEESWTRREKSSEADRLFCLVGFARQKRVPLNSQSHIFPRTNRQPITGLAQAMIYNANPRTRSASGGFIQSRKSVQPMLGWDTLNWSGGATEWGNGKSYMNGWGDFRFLTALAAPLDFVYPPDYGPPTPKIRLNWQCKLVPVAPRNLAWRSLLVRDGHLRERMTSQVVPAIGLQLIGGDFIHH